ncbi:cytochrome p450 [Moniliophthora roreri MCA 2997]|uniref:Cytochrome p450 n=2 Tax=Moniliophthora roreri TaxID=221103 RepID=V2WH13_MONRO|nr:cytochrome p450 [Moniliophthora roreri MCA 2997]
MHTDIAPGLVVIVISGVVFFYFLVKRKPLEGLRGPKGEGYLLGVEYKLKFEERMGELSFKWAKEYGTTYKIPGCFGETILVTCDPRAIYHVLHQHVVDYPTSKDIRKFYELVAGRGVVWVVGDEHKRHRRVLGPAFSVNQTQSFIPLFQRHVQKLAEKWNAELERGTRTIDMVTWCHKVTLDVIGESSFNYHFGALEDKPNELTDALYELEKLGSSPSALEILLQAMPRHLPNFLVNNLRNNVATRYLEVSSEKARELMQKPVSGHMDEEGKDILSVLNAQVQANQAEDPKKRLADHEVTAQISTLLQAGHHTTGYSLAWILYELSRHPADQQRVYEEISRIRARTQGNFTTDDYDELADGWLGACVKESLRLHPVLSQLARTARHDDVIPLEFPIETAAGTTLSHVQVHSGQRIHIDVVAYNQLEDVWGADAKEWNPARFLESSIRNSAVTVGMTSNLLTFSGGPKGCLGWRFALLELHALLAGLLEQFQFDVPEGVEIKDKMAVVIIPLVVGSEAAGARLPLLVQSRTM